MRGMARMSRSIRTTVPLLLALAFLAGVVGVVRPVLAGTTGKVSGRVTEKGTAKPVLAATVIVVGTKLGAYTDAEGNFNILNVPPGVHSVNVSRLGFKSTTVQNIEVSADNTTRIDVSLGDAAVQMEEVIVVAEKPPIDVNLTSTRETVASAEIEQLPVQDLQDVVNLQAGVVDGHIRGGRQQEVQYQVDGVSVNNAYDNSSTLKIDRSLLQEVQVISGTFDAEYGQAMSGVVNAVLKNGTQDFEWQGEAYGGGFYYLDGERRLLDSDVDPFGIRNFQASGSGPLFRNTVFLASLRRYSADAYVEAERRFTPGDSSDFENKIFRPTGDGSSEPLAYNREWSGLLKLTNSSLRNSKISYQAIFNITKSRRLDYAWRYNPDGMRRQRNSAIVHGIDWTQTFNTKTFLEASFRQNYVDYRDWAYEDFYDPRYDDFGSPLSDPEYDVNAIIQGVDFTRFKQRTDALLWKGALTSQAGAHHLLKMGGEFQVPRVEFGVPGYLVFATVDGREQLVRHDNEPPDFPGVKKYAPHMGAVYAQDQLEWDDLTIRAGVRFEYLNARTSIPGDLANPANSIEGAPTAEPVRTSVKTALAPRLGVAYPITEKAGIHFAYGHFYQYPAIGQVFNDADYTVLEDLQAGGVSYRVMGNPDVHAEKTIAYEFGYKQVLNDRYSFTSTVFYKDVRDLLGTEFISTYNGAEYARLTNVDFGSIFGLTLTLGQRNIGKLTTTLDYTYQKAIGQASDPRETATRAAAGADPRPRVIPLNWDQRHTLNLTASLVEPGAWGLSAIFRLASGQPYTPILDTGFGNGLEGNSGRKPSGFVVDLRAEKRLPYQAARLDLFGRVFNALDTRFFNNGVFASTGSPYYSRFSVSDEASLQDPGRFYPPRRIEVGIRLGSWEKEPETNAGTEGAE